MMVYRLTHALFRFGVPALTCLVGAVAALSIHTVTAQQMARTQYESFDLSTPEIAVQTFVDTFRARDYAGLFLIFAPQTQRDWAFSFSAFRFERIMAEADIEAMLDSVSIGFNHTEAEHSPHLTNYMFDEMMLYAEEHDVFLIDLRGDVEILRSEDSTIPAYDEPEDIHDDETPLPVVHIITTVEDIKGEVVFRMVESPSGRWQVMQVIVPGGDERWLPWSVVPDEE